MVHMQMRVDKMIDRDRPSELGTRIRYCFSDVEEQTLDVKYLLSYSAFLQHDWPEKTVHVR